MREDFVLRTRNSLGMVQILTQSAELLTYSDPETEFIVWQDCRQTMNVDKLAQAPIAYVPYSCNGARFFKFGSSIYEITDFAVRTHMELPNKFRSSDFYTFACARGKMFLALGSSLYVIIGSGQYLLCRQKSSIRIFSDGRFLFMLQFGSITEYFTQVQLEIEQPCASLIGFNGYKAVMCWNDEGEDRDIQIMTFNSANMSICDDNDGDEDDDSSSSDTEFDEQSDETKQFLILSGILERQLDFDMMLYQLDTQFTRFSQRQLKFIIKAFSRQLGEKNELQRLLAIRNSNATLLALLAYGKSGSDDDLRAIFTVAFSTGWMYLLELLDDFDVRMAFYFMLTAAAKLDEDDISQIDPLYTRFGQQVIDQLYSGWKQTSDEEQLAALLLRLEICAGNIEAVRKIIEHTHWKSYSPFELLLEYRFENLAMDFIDRTGKLSKNPIYQVSSIIAIERLIPMYWDQPNTDGYYDLLHRLIRDDTLEKISQQSRAFLIDHLAGRRDDDDHLASVYALNKYYTDLDKCIDIIQAESNYFRVQDLEQTIRRLDMPFSELAALYYTVLALITDSCLPVYRLQFMTSRFAFPQLRPMDYIGIMSKRDIFDREFQKLPEYKYHRLKLKRRAQPNNAALELLTRLQTAHRDASLVERSEDTDYDGYYNYDDYDDTDDYDDSDDSDDDDDEEED